MPETHAGRLFDHIHLRVSDLKASRRFYEAALNSLGLEIRGGDGWFASDELFVSADGAPTRNMHLAFQAADHDAVSVSTTLRWLPVAVTTAFPASGRTTPATTPPTFSTPRQQHRGRLPRALRALGAVCPLHLGRAGLAIQSSAMAGTS